MYAEFRYHTVPGTDQKFVLGTVWSVGRFVGKVQSRDFYGILVSSKV